MNIVVFDTETTNLEKPFCYNIGYAVYNTETQECLLAKDFIVEQIWHNKPLFETPDELYDKSKKYKLLKERSDRILNSLNAFHLLYYQILKTKILNHFQQKQNVSYY